MTFLLLFPKVSEWKDLLHLMFSGSWKAEEKGEDRYSQLGSGLDSPDVCTSQVRLMGLTSFRLWPRGSALALWLPSPPAPVFLTSLLASTSGLHGHTPDKPTCFHFIPLAWVLDDDGQVTQAVVFSARTSRFIGPLKLELAWQVYVQRCSCRDDRG